MVCLDISEVCWTEPAFPAVTPSSSSSSLSANLPPSFPVSPSHVWSSITTHDLDPTPSSSLDSAQSGMRYQVSPTASHLYPDYQAYDVFSSLCRLYPEDEHNYIGPVGRNAGLYDVDWSGSVTTSVSDVSIICSYSFTSVESYNSFSSDVLLDISDYDGLSYSEEYACSPASPSLSYTDLFLSVEELGQSTPVILLLDQDLEEPAFSPASPSVSYTNLFFPADDSSDDRKTPVIPLFEMCTSWEHSIEESQQDRKRKREEEEEGMHKHNRRCS